MLVYISCRIAAHVNFFYGFLKTTIVKFHDSSPMRETARVKLRSVIIYIQGISKTFNLHSYYVLHNELKETCQNKACSLLEILVICFMVILHEDRFQYIISYNISFSFTNLYTYTSTEYVPISFLRKLIVFHACITIFRQNSNRHDQKHGQSFF